MYWKTAQGRRYLAGTVLGAIVLVSPAASEAATVPLNGTGQMSYSFQFVAPNSTTPTVANDYSLAVPGQYTFTDTFGPQQTQTPGTSSVGPHSFPDTYPG